ncbi:MAG: T9SS type A sorting domain-containing protein [Flavobacteriales bacterium]
MNKFLLSILAVLAFTMNVSAQEYDFTISTDTYVNLEGTTSLNNGEVWDDPEFTVPLGFSFSYFNEVIATEVYIGFGYGGWITFVQGFSGNIPSLIPYGADIIDRGYDDETGEGTSLSNVSHSTTGEPGNRIMKIEWNNVGFYEELTSDNVSTDFTNFQLWLYEGSNIIEMRFGPNSINNVEQSFETLGGSYVALYPDYDGDNDELSGPGQCLQGSPATAIAQEITTLDDQTFLLGAIPNGTVYRFTPTFVSVEEQAEAELVISPNPVNEVLKWKSNVNNKEQQELFIYNLQGQVVKHVGKNSSAINVAELAPGVYTLQLHGTTGVVTKKFIKQ